MLNQLQTEKELEKLLETCDFKLSLSFENRHNSAILFFLNPILHYYGLLDTELDSLLSN